MANPLALSCYILSLRNLTKNRASNELREEKTCDYIFIVTIIFKLLQRCQLTTRSLVSR